MALNLGSLNLSTVMLGTLPIQLIALGTVPIWQNEVTVTLSNSNNVFTKALFTSDQWNAAVTKRVVIPAGVTIGATLQSHALAIAPTADGQAGSFAGNLIIDVYGSVKGIGGAANSGAGGNAIWGNLLGKAGQKATVNLYAGGELLAGGGGGGSGSASGVVTEGPFFSSPAYRVFWWAGVNGQQSNGWTWNSTVVATGSGSPPSSVVSGGWTYLLGASQGGGPPFNWAISRQQNSSVATNGGRGQGYDGANAAGGTNAGAGGTWGTAGTAGNVGAGGLAGDYIAGASNLNFVNNGGIIAGPALGTTNFVGAPATSGIAYSATPVLTNAGDVGSVTWSVAYSGESPSWASFNSTTGVLSGTPPPTANLNHGTVTITATSAVGSASTTFSLNVRYVNLTGAPATTVDVDGFYSFTPTFNSNDGPGTVAFSVTNKPAWANFAIGNGALTGTPSVTQSAVYSNIVITVTLSSGRSKSMGPFSITVRNGYDIYPSVPLPAGVPVTLIPNDSFPIYEVVQAVVKPAWATVNPTDGYITGTPTVGTHAFQIDSLFFGDVQFSTQFTMTVV